MEWQLTELVHDERIHPFVYKVMEQASLHGGDEKAHHAAKLLYRAVHAFRGFVACRGEQAEIAGVIFFTAPEIKLLFVVDGPRGSEMASALIERALSVMRDEMECPFILFPFPRWISGEACEECPQILARHGFTALSRVLMKASPAAIASSGSSEVNGQSGGEYRIEAWKESIHRSIVLSLLREYPCTSLASLLSDSSPQGLEWTASHLFSDPYGDPLFLPPECSSVALHGARVVGAFLCSDSGLISLVVLHCAHRRKGFARAMLGKAARALVVLEAPALSITVSREDGEGFQWACRAGFEPCEESTLYLWKK
ncbi:MAG: hypothetical protein RDV48_16240 [Candidatus Eremiobacteraeota bacterium]|nr:hypothetical protein [Candidatus Eremiobacteraeota bacterium]